MLKQFVVEILFCKFCIKREQRAVFLCRIGERSCICHILCPIFCHLLLSRIIILLRLLMSAKKILHVGTVHICLRKIRIKFNSLVIILKSITIHSHLYEDGGTVEIGKDIFRIDVQYPVHIIQSIFISTQLGTDEAAIV